VQLVTFLACISGCDGKHDVFSGLVACPTCGGLIDPVLEPTRFNVRDDLDGVWKFADVILPELDASSRVTLGEGDAPFVSLDGMRVMQCGENPTGSFKDLGMTVLSSAAVERRRRGQPVRVLACASTGDTSASLAAYGARAGIPVVVLLPRGKVSAAQLAQPLAYNATVLELDGDFDACMAVVQQLGAVEGVWLANSKNPLRLLGQMTVAFEIARAGLPRTVVVPSGNLGNVAALFMGFSLMKRLGAIDRIPELVAVQVEAANPFAQAFQRGFDQLRSVKAGETRATAIRIGDPVSYPRAVKAIKGSNGRVISVSEDALLDAMTNASRQGLLACPQTAAALAGAKGLDDVVVVSTASGLKFLDEAPRATPVSVDASWDAVKEALAGVLS
jgi:threonine synthase